MEGRLPCHLLYSQIWIVQQQIMTTKAKQNPYLIFAPFLVFYLLICAFFHKDKLQGDEGRYLEFAHNLLHGYYSPPSPRQSLWSGPGYPILLMPFVGLGLPLV